MRFESWPVLLLVLLIPLLHRWWMRRNQPAKVTFSLAIPVQVKSSNPVRWLLGLKYLGLALLLVALARPQSSFRQTNRSVSGIDIVLLQDVSASMNIEDMSGDKSRLEVAKETLVKFVRGRSNDRIGFEIFSGEPLTLVPPTLDYQLVLRSIQTLELGVLKDGTAIGDGLALAVNRLKDSKAKSRVIILTTDGDNNLGQVDPATAGELAAGYGIRVYTIAIGREGRVKMPIRHPGIFGQMVTTYQWFDNALNPELLQVIARTSHGKFFRVEDASTLESVFNEIDQLERNEVKTTEKVRYEEEFEKPLAFGFGAMVFEKLLSSTWFRVLP